jgi:hypothetical protein
MRTTMISSFDAKEGGLQALRLAVRCDGNVPTRQRFNFYAWLRARVRLPREAELAREGRNRSGKQLQPAGWPSRRNPSQTGKHRGSSWEAQNVT